MPCAWMVFVQVVQVAERPLIAPALIAAVETMSMRAIRFIHTAVNSLVLRITRVLVIRARPLPSFARNSRRFLVRVVNSLVL